TIVRGDVFDATGVDGPAARGGGRRLPEEGDGVSAGDGGPRPARAAVPRLRHGGAAHPLRGQRDELLPALPDGRHGAGRPRPVAPPEGRLAAHRRGTRNPPRRREVKWAGRVWDRGDRARSDMRRL